jgi:CsoR family transcriptional regulator, copper-sensing transcriptional repressor
MEHNTQLLTRLKIIAGHIRGVERMTEADAYCITIIQQVQAVQRALEKFNHLVLAEHLNSEVTTTVLSDQPAERERVITELLTVFHESGEQEPILSSAPAQAERIPRRTAYLQQIEERVRAVQQMVQTKADHVAIITQIKGVGRMLNAFSARILEDHLNGCVITAIRSEQPAERERVIKELLNVFDTAHTLQYQKEAK